MPTHELHAQTAGHELAPPFPRSISAILFKWKRRAAEANVALQVRWIAENVPGVDKNRLIASAESYAAKLEGEFTLTKPSAGFPPGAVSHGNLAAGKNDLRGEIRDQIELIPANTAVYLGISNFTVSTSLSTEGQSIVRR